MTEISNMTVDQLEKHILDAQEILKKKKAEQVEENRQKIEEFAKNLGTSVAEAFNFSGSLKGKKKKEIKVRYIDDDGKSWGRASKEWTPEKKKRFQENAKIN